MEGAGFAAEDQELGGPKTGAPVYVVVDEVTYTFATRAGSCGEADGITHDVFGDRDLTNDAMAFEQFLTGEESVDFLTTGSGGLRDDPHFVVFAKVVDDDIEHETI